MIRSTGLLSEISTATPEKWENEVYLTFDIDWAHDEIVGDLINILEQYSVSATIFGTHKSEVLEHVKKQPEKYEIGIHPNFNPLLVGTSNNKNADRICGDLMNIFPDAKSVRSHSLCFGSFIQDIYQKYELSHDSSLIVPFQKNTRPLFPWEMWDGLVRAPYFFCDYVTSMTGAVTIATLLERGGLKVFSFHPIHVFLNTESIARYEGTRSIHREPQALLKERYDGYGTRNMLIELLELLEQSHAGTSEKI